MASYAKWLDLSHNFPVPKPCQASSRTAAGICLRWLTSDFHVDPWEKSGWIYCSKTGARSWNNGKCMNHYIPNIWKQEPLSCFLGLKGHEPSSRIPESPWFGIEAAFPQIYPLGSRASQGWRFWGVPHFGVYPISDYQFNSHFFYLPPPKKCQKVVSTLVTGCFLFLYLVSMGIPGS